MSYIVGLKMIETKIQQEIYLVAVGPTETLNGQVGKHKTTAKVAAACEMSTRRGAKARLFPRAFRLGRMKNIYYKYSDSNNTIAHIPHSLTLTGLTQRHQL